VKQSYDFQGSGRGRTGQHGYTMTIDADYQHAVPLWHGVGFFIFIGRISDFGKVLGYWLRLQNFATFEAFLFVTPDFVLPVKLPADFQESVIFLKYMIGKVQDAIYAQFAFKTFFREP
jgi:hypothetical protein